MRLRIVLLTCLLLPLFAVACGLKGPLYLPETQAVDTQQESEQEEVEEDKKKSRS